MYSYDITLSEFVCSIPICQPESDLGSILQIFHQTNCESLAISTQNCTWGIISSGDILSFLAKSWQKLPIATVAYPKQIPYQRKTYGSTDRDWYSIIQPAIVCQAETSLQEFLESLENSYLRIGRSDYLVVNRTGELQGKLDRDKLLRYIAAKSKQRKTDFRSISSSNPWLSLLDNLALPLKIETTERKNCYENQYWQKLVDRNREDCSVQSERLNVSIADWWINQQLNLLQNYSPEQNKTIKSPSIDKNMGEFCCLENPSHFSRQSNISQAFESIGLNSENLTAKQLPSEEFNDPSCLFEDLIDRPENEPGIQIKADLEWSYIKIPLRLEDWRWSKSLSATQYWLILAIKSSFISPNNRQPKESDLDRQSLVARLLATISHELKSPLTGIIGLTNLLDSQQIGNLNQRQAQYVKLIHNSGQKLMSIVNHLIELTSLTTGKSELQPEAVNLEHLCHQLYRQMLTKLETADSTESDLLMLTSGIELDIQPRAEIAIADKLRLSSILSHLMLETIHSDELSSIALKITAHKSDTHHHITVENQGINTSVLSPQNSHQADRSIGLNLIIAQYLARAVRGKIENTYFAKGCSFTLLLPIVKPQSDNLSAISQQTANICQNNRKNLTILCLYPESEVIDSKIECDRNLDFNLKKLSEQDWCDNSRAETTKQYRIIEADGLEQAHVLARIWQLDAIVLDGYQIVDPYEYLQTLQKSEYLSALPLITLDIKTTEAGNRIEGLNVYPCLLPAQCRSVKDLMQVIQIATEQ